MTLLFPFLPWAKIDEPTLEALGDIFAAFPRCMVDFNRVRWFDSRVVWLEPAPGELFVSLTGALVARFPECQPFGGTFSDVVPHLTLAADRRKPILHLAEALGRRAIPLREPVTETWLMAADEQGRWRLCSSFPLGDNGTA